MSPIDEIKKDARSIWSVIKESSPVWVVLGLGIAAAIVASVLL